MSRPSAYTSVRGSVGRPLTCSGARYRAVPITVPVRVRSSAPAALAMPKSVTLTGPAGWHQHVRRLHVAVHEPGPVRGVERVGDLLADADHVGAPGGRPCSSMRWRSVGPSTSSITMYAMPSSSPVS